MVHRFPILLKTAFRGAWTTSREASPSRSLAVRAIGGAVDGGEGAAKGAAIGAATAVIRKGESVTVPPGAVLEFRLTQLLAVAVTGWGGGGFRKTRKDNTMNFSLKPVTVVVVLGIAAGCGSTPSAEGGTSSRKSGVLGDPAHAYMEAMRKELSAGKSQIYHEVMSPTVQEAAAFWPIYGEYEEQRLDLGDRRLEILKRFSQAYNAGKLDAAKSASIAAEFLKLQEEWLDLLKKYHAIIAKEVSPLQAGQFLQIEHRLATVIDLLVAAEMPLLRLQPIGANPAPAKE